MLITFLKQQRSILCFIILFSLATPLAAQTTTLYSENFDYPDGTTTSSLWTINVSQCNLTGADSHFEVLAQRFEGRNTDGEAVWYSNIINISGYKIVNASMNIAKAGALASTDYMKVSYILNGGPETPFAVNGTDYGNFTGDLASQDSLNGSTLQLIVRVNNNSAGKKQQFYNVLITGDNPVTIPLSLSLSASPATCAQTDNGADSLTVTGGTPPYTYQWSNNAVSQNITNVPAGVYSVTVTDATHTTATAADTVQELPPIVLSFFEWNASPSSSDGLARVSVSGGTPPYSILWSTDDSTTNIYTLAPGIYDITVTDANNCFDTGSVAINTSISTTLFYEDFDGPFNNNWTTISFDNNLTNYWSIISTPCSINGNSLQIMNGDSTCHYDKHATQDIISYAPVNATGFDSLVLNFTWSANGEKNYDYGSIWYSFDAVNWQRDSMGGDGSGWYSIHPEQATQSILLPDTLINQSFYIGFNWDNDNTLGSDEPFVVDDISITGLPYTPAVNILPNTCTWMGNTDTSWFNSQNWDCARVPLLTDNVIITAGAPFTPNIIPSQGAVCDTLTIQAGATLVMSDTATLQVNGDIISASTVILQGGNVLLTSDTVQHITWPDSSQFYNLVIQNNSDTGVVILSNVNVANTISLVNGYLQTGDDTVIIINPYPNGAALLSYSNQSHIVGNLRRYITPNYFSYEFPVGNMADSALYVATVVPNNLQGVNYLNARFAPLTNCSGKGFEAEDSGVYYNKICPEGVWVIEPDNAPDSGTYNIQLGIQNIHQLQDNTFAIIKRPVGSSVSAFSNGGGALPPDNSPGRIVADGYALRTGLPGFSEFAIAMRHEDTANNYDATHYYVDGEEVGVLFKDTRFGKNTRLQRSDDGENFYTLPKDTTQLIDTFRLIDEHPLKGLAFYRLEMVNNDNDTIHSEVTAVNNVNYADEQMLAFPNPTRGLINIRLQSKATNVDITVSDMSGNVLYTYSTVNNGDMQINLTGQLAAGDYFVRLIIPSETFIRKITVLK